MNLRNLGNTGTIVSSFCLGTMTFGAESDEKASHDILSRFFEGGGNFVDTADVYSLGVSEEIVGRWLASNPDKAGQSVIATKGRFPMGKGPNDLGLSRRHLQVALDDSLRRLQIECIDLYQMHAWDAMTPIDETLRFLDDAVSAGKIRYYGFSNYLGWQLTKAVHRAKALGFTAPATLQPQYNLLARDIEHEIVPACQDAKMGLLPWAPLGGGWLAGKYNRDEVPTGATRLGENPERGMEAYAPRNEKTRTWTIIETVKDIAARINATPAQVSLSWLRDRPAVTSVILGARTVAQLDDNLGAADLVLSAEDTETLNQVSTPQVDDYPYGDQGRMQRNRRIEGGR